MTLAEKIRNSVTEIASFSMGSCLDGQPVHIGFGTDAAYARPMGVSLTSIAVNNPEVPLVFHVFESSIAAADIERLKLLAKDYPNISLKLYQVDEDVIAHLPTLKHFTLAMYFRLMMPLVLENIDRILYLDSDILCLNDITELRDLSFDRFICAAALDEKYVRDEKVIELDLKSGNYFNSGVLFMNIAKWREEKISEQVFSVLESARNELSLPDQDALNLILEGKVLYLPSWWNFLPDMYRDLADDNMDSRNNIIFLHCTFHPKPWKAACRSSLQTYYLMYEQKSPWLDQNLLPPATYREARYYANKLLRQGNAAGALFWYGKYLTMKISTKLLK